MPSDQLAERLAEIAVLATPAAPQPVEWAVAQLDAVRVYVDGQTVGGVRAKAPCQPSVANVSDLRPIWSAA